jgi:hypothetical protein
MIEPKTVEEPRISNDTALDIKRVNKLSGELEQIKNATEDTEQEPGSVPVDMTEIALSEESEERITTNILAVHLGDEMEKIKDNLEKTFNGLRDSGEVNALLELANLENPGDQAEARKIIDETLKQDYPAFGLIYDEVVREKNEPRPKLEAMRLFIAEVNASETDQDKLDGTGVEFSGLKSAKQVCDEIDEQMRGLPTATDTDAAIASINKLIAQAWAPNREGADSSFKKLYIAWGPKIEKETGIKIKEKSKRRVEALLKERQKSKDAPKAKEAADEEAAKKAEFNEAHKGAKEGLQRAERREVLKKLEGLKKVASDNKLVINELDKTPRGEQLPDLKIKLVAPPYIDELVPGNPPDMTREEALIGELKRLTIVMLENKMPEYTADEKNDKFDATKIYKDSIQLPFNHALRQIIDIYKGTISKNELIEAIKSSVLPRKFSEPTIEKIVSGMIAEVAVQDVAKNKYGEENVRDSTTVEDRRGSDFFVKVRVIYFTEKTEDLWFGLDVKTGRQQDSKIQKNNKVVIDPDHIDSDTFSVWRGNVGTVEESIANAIEAQLSSFKEIVLLKDSGRAAA